MEPGRRRVVRPVAHHSRPGRWTCPGSRRGSRPPSTLASRNAATPVRTVSSSGTASARTPAVRALTARAAAAVSGRSGCVQLPEREFPIPGGQSSGGGLSASGSHLSGGRTRGLNRPVLPSRATRQQRAGWLRRAAVVRAGNPGVWPFSAGTGLPGRSASAGLSGRRACVRPAGTTGALRLTGAARPVRRADPAGPVRTPGTGRAAAPPAATSRATGHPARAGQRC
jgi:hypothetical protein